MNEILWNNTLRDGGKFSMILKRHHRLKINTQGEGANLAVLAYNATLLSERYNMPDTLKGQHTAFLTKGNCLYSDMGRVLLSIVEDTCGWHDTIGGLNTREQVLEKFGAGKYQDLRNKRYRNGMDNFLTELGKWGLGKRDIVSNINLFSKVWVDEESGSIHYDKSNSVDECSVTLRSEMDTLLILSATYHPLYGGPYEPKDIHLELYGPHAPDDNDICRIHCEQNTRAFTNTENFVQLGV